MRAYNALNKLGISFVILRKAIFLWYIAILKNKSDGFGLETEIAAKVFRHGYSVVEVSVSYKRRKIEEGKKLEELMWKYFQDIPLNFFGG